MGFTGGRAQNVPTLGREGSSYNILNLLNYYQEPPFGNMGAYLLHIQLMYTTMSNYEHQMIASGG